MPGGTSGNSREDRDRIEENKEISVDEVSTEINAKETREGKEA